MFRKKSIALLTLMLAFTLTAIGCSKNNSDNESANNQAEPVSVSNENTIKIENAVDKAESSEENAVSDDGREIAENNEDMHKYEAFLNNEEPLYFTWFINSGNSELLNWEYDTVSRYFKADTAYTLSDFVSTCSEVMTEDWGEDTKPQDFAYGYMDCGADGNKELVITLKEECPGQFLYDDMWIVKNIDDKLQVIFYMQYGYRSSLSMNEYGYCYYGGSNGAASHMDEYYYLDADGKLNYVYGMEDNYGIWSIYAPDNDDLMQLGEELHIDESIEALQYHFDKYRDTDDYSEYFKSSMWLYYKIDENYERISDTSIYEEGSDFKTYWDATGFPLNTEEEIDAAIKNRESGFGINEKIKSGKEIELNNFEIPAIN